MSARILTNGEIERWWQAGHQSRGVTVACQFFTQRIKQNYMEAKSNSKNVTEPVTPSQVIRLIAHARALKSWALAALLECKGHDADAISEAFDNDEISQALFLIEKLGDHAIEQACLKMKGAQ